jgi:hypothetical protein
MFLLVENKRYLYGISLRKKFSEAVKDFRYLLSRGYNREGALAFVGDRCQLTREERLTLYRGVYAPRSADKHRKKLLPIDAIRGKRLAVDGYNVLITVETMLSDKPLVLCDDYFIRDVSAVHGKHKPTRKTRNALNIILKFLNKCKPMNVCFSYDAQVSRSGELAALTRTLMGKVEVKGSARAVKQADIYAVKSGDIIASSDAVIIEKAKKVVDLAGEIVRVVVPNKLLRLTEI